MPSWQEAFQHLADVQARPTIVDPDLVSEFMEYVGAPEVSKATKDNNRYTMYVPYDHTTLSLGNKSPGWINDVGITGRTDNHIHMLVRGVDDPLDNTIVSLGGPSASVTIEEYDEGMVAGLSHGYTMVTSGVGWHEAKGNHYMLSREGEISIRAANAQAALLQSDEGSVSVLGGGGATMATGGDLMILASPGAKFNTEVKYNSMWSWDGDNAHGAPYWASKIAVYAGLAVVTGVALKGLMAIFKPVTLKPMKFFPGWTPLPAIEKIAAVKDLLLTGSTLVNASLDWGAAAEAAAGTEGGFTKAIAKGNVGINAEKYANMNAGIASTVYGHLGAYLFSSGTADMIGVIAASMSGVGWASVWAGLSASVNSLGFVTVAAEYGSTEIKGKKGVTVSSEVGAVEIQGSTGARLNSLTSTVVHGLTKAYVGSGTGLGFGMVATPLDISIGEVVAPQSFATAKVSFANAMKFTSAMSSWSMGTTQVKLLPAVMTMKSAAVNVSATAAVKIEGSVVLLG